jgi:hypothetical protein
LKYQALLPRDLISRLRNFVTRTSNLNHVPLDINLRTNHTNRQASNRIYTSSSLLLLSRSTTGKIGLMLSALGVGEVGTIVLVDGQAESTFEGSDVVLEEVGVFVQVNSFESKFAQTLSSVSIGG